MSTAQNSVVTEPGVGTTSDDLARGGDAMQIGEVRKRRYRVEITGGPQFGATTVIDTDVACKLGSAIESDVVLLDPQVDDLALTFKTDLDGKLMIQVHSGTLERNQQPVANDEPLQHVENATYHIGASAFTLTAIDPGKPTLIDGEVVESGDVDAMRSQGAADRTVDQDAFDVDLMEEQERNPGGHAWGRPEAVGSELWLPRILFGVAAVLCVAIGVSYLLHSNGTGEDDPATTTVVPSEEQTEPREAKRLVRLEQSIVEAGFETVALATDGSSATPRVTGYVTSREELNELRQMLRGVIPRSAISVHVQNNIVEGVRNVYRTNGVKAAVESAGPGAVSVVTEQQSPDEPDFLKTAAMEDVAGLVAIDVRNSPPSIDAPEPKVRKRPPPGVEKAGKRVIAVVQGAPSYVVTEDDSRYFVGSSLPTGHTIEAIEDQSVMLEWHGQKTRLEF